MTQPIPLAAVKAGRVESQPEDLASFTSVYRQRYRPMVGLAMLLLGDQPQAEEVVQDAFAAAYLRWARLDTPVAYIRQSVTNGCRDALRRRRVAERFRWRRVAPDAVEPHEHIDDLLATLPARQRTIVVLRFYEDQTVDQIADLLSMRAGTVKSLLHRAMTRLREELDG